MKKVKLDISLEGLNLSEEDKSKSPSEIMTAVIENVILGYSNQKRGLDEKERKQYYKISDALESASKEKKVEVDMDDDWVGFIRNAFKECRLMPNMLLRRVEEKISEIKDR